MTRVLKYKDKVKTVRTGEDKNREKARYKSGRVHDGRSRVPTQEYIDGWNAIYRKEEDEKEK
jgi:hypothetical protein